MAKKANSKPVANVGATQSNRPTAGGRLSWQSFRVQAILLGVICFVFYCNTFSHQSAFDDRMAITDNDHVQRGVAGIKDILTKDAYQSYLEHQNGANQLQGGRYRPLSLITFALEQQVMGISDDEGNEREARVASQMPVRHVVNVLLYLLSVIALLYLFRKVIFPGEEVVAFFAALIFAVHPLHTEVVANVKSRDEILSVLFIALTFIKAFRYRESHKVSDLAMSLVCFLLALLSKEYAVTLLLLLPVSFYVFRKDTLKASVKNTLLYLVPFAVYLLLRFNAVSAAAEGAEGNLMNNPYLLASPAQKVATELLCLHNYLKLLVYPTPLICDYTYNAIPYTSFSNVTVWLAAFVYFALFTAAIILCKRRHVLGFAIAFYLVNILLVSNFFINIGTPLGERLVYHSSVGFAIAAAFLLHKGFAQLTLAKISRGGFAGFMILLVVISGYVAISRNREWKNDETLFLADVQKSPNSVLLNNDAAAACMSEARRNASDVAVRNEWFGRAIGYFDKAISIYPVHAMAYLNRGLCYFNMGMPEKALQNWDSVRKYEPNQPNLAKYMNIAAKYFFGQGERLMAAGLPDSAILAYHMSTEADPSVKETWYKLALAYYSLGRYGGAENALSRAGQLDPAYEDAKKLAERLKAVNSDRSAQQR